MHELHEAMLWNEGKNNAVECVLCSHYCKISEGQLGVCRCRLNSKGKLYSLNYGKSTGLALDPIEKKPFYHFKPGSFSLSFGTPGCNFRCENCQNYLMSQSPKEAENAFDFPSTPPDVIAKEAAQQGVDGIAYTYSEPTIFFEYARDTIKETKKSAKEKYHVFVSNGYFSKECFDLIVKEKLLDAIRIDLKSFDDSFYAKVCGAKLEPVLENIKRVAKSKMHLEVICLVIPTLNDSEDDLRARSEFLASVSKDIPVHFIRFFPHYKLSHLPPTPEETLERAKRIAEDAGLKYVYVGNTSGESNTFCPKCGELLIRRSAFALVENKLRFGVMEQGASGVRRCREPECPECGEKINVVL